MRSAFRFVSNSTLAAAATLVVVLAPAPASADLEADVKSCQARETPPKERLVVCQKIIDSDVLNQKQMVVALYARLRRFDAAIGSHTGENSNRKSRLYSNRGKLIGAGTEDFEEAILIPRNHLHDPWIGAEGSHTIRFCDEVDPCLATGVDDGLGVVEDAER